MATFELDDAVVRRFVEGAQMLDWLPAAELGEALEKQLPQPVPTGMGALIRLENGWLGVLADLGGDGRRWRLSSHGGTEFEGWAASTDLPARIIDVLSPGVEL